MFFGLTPTLDFAIKLETPELPSSHTWTTIDGVEILFPSSVTSFEGCSSWFFPTIKIKNHKILKYDTVSRLIMFHYNNSIILSISYELRHDKLIALFKSVYHNSHTNIIQPCCLTKYRRYSWQIEQTFSRPASPTKYWKMQHCQSRNIVFYVPFQP